MPRSLFSSNLYFPDWPRLWIYWTGGGEGGGERGGVRQKKYLKLKITCHWESKDKRLPIAEKNTLNLYDSEEIMVLGPICMY